MCYLRHSLRIFFILQKSYVPFSRYPSVCIFNHLMHDLANLRRHDEYQYKRQGAFLNISFEPQLIKFPNLANSYNNRNNFQECFEDFGRLGLSSRSISIQQPAQLLKNQLCQDSSVSIFEKVNKGQLKMVNLNY